MKLKFTLSSLAIGIGVYFIFWVLTLLVGSIWIARGLTSISDSKRENTEVVTEFGSYLNSNKDFSLAEKKEDPPLTNDRNNLKLSSNGKPEFVNDSFLTEDDPITQFLQDKENEDLVQDAKRCLGGNRSDLINALVVVNRPRSVISQEDYQLSQQIMTRIRSHALAFGEDFWLGLRGMEGIENCALQRQVLLDVQSLLQIPSDGNKSVQ